MLRPTGIEAAFYGFSQSWQGEARYFIGMASDNPEQIGYPAASRTGLREPQVKAPAGGRQLSRSALAQGRAQKIERDNSPGMSR